MAMIDNFESDTLLSGTGGKDSIYNSGHNVTINTGAGNDYVENWYGSQVIINTGAGNDSVDNDYSDSVTINTGAGNDYVYNNRSDSVTINTGAGNDYVDNWNGSQVIINTGAGDDSVDNYGSIVTINAESGNNYISNDGDKVTINTGDGNDYVWSYGDSVTINAGDGNDFVYNKGTNISINTGAGNDKIFNNCYRKDNGSIDYLDDNDGSNVVFKYAAGDGYDTIWGFKADSTLSIGGGKGTYSTVAKGDDIIVTVGKGKINLVGAASLSKLNIKGTNGGGSSETNSWKLSGTTATYGTSSNTLITITGIKSLDGISLSGTTVTVSASALNKKTNVTLSGSGYKLKLGFDVAAPTTKTATWSYKSGTATYKSASTTAGYTLASNAKSISYTKAKAASTLTTVKGVKSADGLTVSGKVVTVAASSLNKSKVTLTGDGYKLALADNVSKPTSKKAAWSYKGGTATYKSSSTTAGYTLASNAKSIGYTKAKAASTLATVKGVKSADGLSVSGKVVTIAASALNKSKVTLTGDGYKLALADDVSKPTSKKATWSYKSGTATYNSSSTTAGYTLASNAKSISYTKAKAASTLTTVKGVKSADGLTVSGKVVTVAASALNKSNITISNGYKLALADDVSASANAKTDWDYKNSVATLSQTKGDKYSLASNGKSISYTAGTSKNLAKISGVTSADGLPTSGKVITVPNSIIATSKKVGVNGSGYEFKFAAQKTSISGSKNADIITSTGAKATINGGTGDDQINISGANNVVVYKAGDGSDTITNYSEDDTIKITSGAATATTSGADVVFSVGNGSILLKGAADKTISYITAKGTATTFSASASDSSDSSEPYTISANGKSVVLSSSYAEENFEVGEIKNGNKIATIDTSAVTHKLKIIGNNLANSIKGGSGNNTLRGEGDDDTLTGGKGSDVFIYYEGDGNDVITDYEAKDTIKISGNVTPSTLRSDVVLSVGAGKITVKNAHENGVGITYTENGVEQDYISGEQTTVFNQSKKSLTLTANYWKESLDFANFGKSIQTLEASAITHKLKITGNDKSNKILGGSGDDTLIGGKGNDTLQGNSGKNVFVYNKGDGDDTIYNFGENDVISIVSGKVDYTTFGGADNKSVILKIGDGQIVLDNAAGQKITYYDTEHTSKPFSAIPSNVVEAWFVADDDNFATGNDLSALVQSNSTDYSLAEVETSLKSANALDNLTYSTKK